jgi:hypothetical protein
MSYETKEQDSFVYAPSTRGRSSRLSNLNYYQLPLGMSVYEDVNFTNCALSSCSESGDRE